MDKDYWMDRVRNGYPFGSLSMELRDDDDFCLAAIGLYGSCFEHISDRLKDDYDFCLKVIRLSPEIIKDIPVFDIERYHNLCLAAVGLNGWVLMLIPEEFRVRDICLAAFDNNVGILGLIPLEIRDFDLCLAARIKRRDILVHIPIKWRRRIEFMVRLLEVGDCYSLIMGERVIYG